jgi:hypothetical protein
VPHSKSSLEHRRADGWGGTGWGRRIDGDQVVSGVPRSLFPLQREYKWVCLKFKVFFLSLAPSTGVHFLLFFSFPSLLFHAARAPRLIAIRKLIARLRYVAFVENIGKLIVTGGNIFVELQDPRKRPPASENAHMRAISTRAG